VIVYLDTVIIIYLVEETEPYYQKVVERLDNADLILYTSEIARLECRVKPLRDHNDYLLTVYDQFFDNQLKSIIGLTRVVIDKATVLRATYGCKTPDALHLAAAITNGCNVFLTNDHRLDICKEIAVEIL